MTGGAENLFGSSFFNFLTVFSTGLSAFRISMGFVTFSGSTSICSVLTRVLDIAEDCCREPGISVLGVTSDLAGVVALIGSSGRSSSLEVEDSLERLGKAALIGSCAIGKSRALKGSDPEVSVVNSFSSGAFRALLELKKRGSLSESLLEELEFDELEGSLLRGSSFDFTIRLTKRTTGCFG